MTKIRQKLCATTRVTFRGRKVFLDGQLYGKIVGQGIQRGRGWITDGNYRVERLDGTVVTGQSSYMQDCRRSAEWQITQRREFVPVTP
jgi:hypothetical protein